MNFDRIAPFYDAMETWLAGPCLHRSRTAFLDRIPDPRQALLVGEGHGRFLEVVRLKFPDARITVIDGSAKMLEIARRRLPDARSVTFVHSMIEEWETDERYDLIVTNFFLDCLDERGMERVIGKLSSLAAVDADWLVADFRIAEKGFAKWRGKIIVGMLYRFFRCFTGIRANRLVPPDEKLMSFDFTKIESRTHDWGLLKSEWWRRSSRRL